MLKRVFPSNKYLQNITEIGSISALTAKQDKQNITLGPEIPASHLAYLDTADSHSVIPRKFLQSYKKRFVKHVDLPLFKNTELFS